MSPGYNLYGIRDEFSNKGELTYSDRLKYARNEKEAIELRDKDEEEESWIDWLPPRKIFVFPMFYSDIVSYEFEFKNEGFLLKQEHKRKQMY